MCSSARKCLIRKGRAFKGHKHTIDFEIDLSVCVTIRNKCMYTYALSEFNHARDASANGTKTFRRKPFSSPKKHGNMTFIKKSSWLSLSLTYVGKRERKTNCLSPSLFSQPHPPFLLIPHCLQDNRGERPQGVFRIENPASHDLPPN